MGLKPGERVGPYEILSLIGAGGMGEVYRARDERLGRDVAVKVLLASVASEPGGLQRFEVEARAAGALNHPGVVAVFDIGVHDQQPYIVAELLDGETLRRRMAGSPLPLRKAIDHAVQIARGLAAAHVNGIVHRDLKPENLFVTRDGRVKILDFGLAKLSRPQAKLSSQEATVSRDGPATSPGAVLGTVGYMSPEQVRGRLADSRADIFSLGAVLFEMLSGRRAFDGETAADTMHAILRRDPLERTGADRSLPPNVERLVRRCLEKVPDERFQSASDLAFSLEALSEASNSGFTHGRPGLPSWSSIRRSAWWAAALALTAAGALVLGRTLREAPATPSFQRMSFKQGQVLSARFAADGETVVFSAAWQGGGPQVFLTRAGSAESRPLDVPEATLLSISSANEIALLLRPRVVGFYTYQGTLARAPLGGGAPREVAEDVQDADWSPDGKELAVIHIVDGRWRLEFPVGKILYSPPPPTWLSDVRVSPQGDRIAFVEHPAPGDRRGSVAVVDLLGRKQTLAAGFVNALGLAWPAKSRELWFSGSRGEGTTRPPALVLAVSLSGQERVVMPAPVATALFDVARNGNALLRRVFNTAAIFAVAAGDSRARDVSERDFSHLIDLSRDGRMMVGAEAGEGGGAHEAVFVRRFDSPSSVWVGEGSALALSPDGKRVLVNRFYTTPQTLVVVPTGPGRTEELPRGNVERYLQGKWFPHGNRILFVGAEPAHGPRLYVQQLDGGAPRAVSAEGFELPPGATISADGRSTLALDADQTPVLHPLEGGDPSAIAGLESGDLPIGWTEGGKGLFFFRTEEAAPKVFELSLATSKTRMFRQLLPARPSGMYGDYRLLVTPNGQTLVYNFQQSLSDLYLARGLR